MSAELLSLIQSSLLNNQEKQEWISYSAGLNENQQKFLIQIFQGNHEAYEQALNERLFEDKEGVFLNNLNRFIREEKILLRKGSEQALQQTEEKTTEDTLKQLDNL